MRSGHEVLRGTMYGLEKSGKRYISETDLWKGVYRIYQQAIYQQNCFQVLVISMFDNNMERNKS